MGTSIDGFILSTGSLDEAFAILHARKSETRKMVVDAHSKFIALGAQTMVDMSVIDPARVDGDISRPVSWTEGELRRRQKAIRETGYRDTDVDFDFSVCLFPIEEKVIGTLYAEQESFKKWFHDLPEVGEYRYYDGSDSYLDRFTQEEWDERLRVWNLAFNDFRDTPAEAGLSINLGISLVLPSRIDVMAHVEAKTVRASRYARKRVLDEEMRRVMKPGSGAGDISHIVKALYEAESYMKTDEAKVVIVEKEAEILSRLPDLTEEMLLGFKPRD